MDQWIERQIDRETNQHVKGLTDRVFDESMDQRTEGWTVPLKKIYKDASENFKQWQISL